MHALFAELYVVAVAVIGLGIGFYLNSRMESTGEIAVQSPSPFKEGAQAYWIAQEGPAVL